MQAYLNNYQMEQLHRVLFCIFDDAEQSNAEKDNDILPYYLAAKKIEGCSEKTLRYYETTVTNALASIDKTVKHITTDDLRQYLDLYQRRNNAGKVTIDNIRRVLSSFFSWLEDEDYILKSPVRRIHKVKTGTTVKETYSDEALEIMRDHAENIRDLAMIDLLASTGMRVGEMVKLNREDIDFENRECIVFGKGDKERKVYFDARAKIHLQNYLHGRTDEDPALFVTLLKPYNRLNISGVEIRLRELGRKLNIPKVHPHKFRRTLATMAIDYVAAGISRLSFSAMTSVHISPTVLALFLALYAALAAWLYNKHFRYAIASLAITLAIAIACLIEYASTPQSGFVIQNSYASTPILHFSHGTCRVWCPDDSIDIEQFSRYNSGFLSHYGLHKIALHNDTLPHHQEGCYINPPFACLNGYRLAVISETKWRHYHARRPVYVDYLVIASSYYGNIADLLDTFAPRTIVLSGGIYEDKTSRLMKGTDTLSLPPIHHLRTDGAIFVTGWSPSGHEPSSLP